MVLRKEYINILNIWKNESVIKVVTGIRRCGKSTLLSQFQDELKKDGTNDDQIISINFEELEFEDLLDYKKLYSYIKDRLNKDKYSYIFLDEIQKVQNFEKVVDSLYVKENVDIYITGSNSYMLSSDLSTYLTGRYVEIKLLPISFSEFLSTTTKDKIEAFSEYLKIGGFPYIVSMDKTSEKLNMFLEGIYNTVVVNDIAEHQNSKRKRDVDKRKITDITLLKNIAKYLASVIGNLVSIKSITDYLNSNGRKVSANTVNDYVESLVESFIFYPVEQFNISGKHILKANRKFYMVDLGLRNFILPKKDYDFGFSLENIVYFELLRRGNQINIGRQGNLEIDFVAQKNGVFSYYQVTADMTANETFQREITPLKMIKDNYKKIILTMDYNTLGNYEGIEVIHILDWLTTKAD